MVRARRARRAAALLLTVLAALAFSPPARGEPTALHIGKIRIESLDVFSPEEAARGWIYRAADAIHIQTRPSVIRRFLLFREGDAYDPARLAETERNLRALPFIKMASVTAGAPHDGVVDVEVVTQDTWTLEPGVAYGTKGGVTTYGFSFQEKNLLGSGQAVSVDYDKGVDRTTRQFMYRDPYLFGPYWNGTLLYASNSDGREEGALIARPFYSFLTPWATQASYDRLQQHEKVYTDGSVSSEFSQDHREVVALYGLASVATEGRAARWTAGLDSVEDSFGTLPGRTDDVLPAARKFRYVFVQYDDVRNDYLKLNYVNRDLRYEDFNLGWVWTARAAYSPAALGAPNNSGFVLVQGSRGWRVSRGGFVLGSLSWQGRLDGGVANGMLTAEANFVHKFETSLRQTFVSRLLFEKGWNLDRDVQFFADGLTGLRGYRVHSFSGDKALIVNLEQRFFSGREILQVVAPGAAAFVDTGIAEPAGRPIRLGDLKTDAGIGLRFGVARAPETNTIRVDFAYAFDKDPRGRRGLLVSVSSSQAF